MDDFIYLEVMFQNMARQPMTLNDAIQWAAQYGLTMPVIHDGNASVWDDYRSPGGYIPTNVVIGADFVIRYFDSGYDSSAIAAAVEEALCEFLPPGTPVGSNTCP